MQFNFNVTQATGVFTVIMALLMVILIIPMCILNAWVITKLWGWYMVPAFGLQPLRLVYAYGLSVFVGMFRTGYYGEDNRTLSLKIAAVVALPISSLFLGWLGTFFM